jgi:hypothetical protein
MSRAEPDLRPRPTRIISMNSGEQPVTTPASGLDHISTQLFVDISRIKRTQVTGYGLAKIETAKSSTDTAADGDMPDRKLHAEQQMGETPHGYTCATTETTEAKSDKTAGASENVT